MRIQSETRSLPTKLTPDELAEESKRLAEAVEAVEKQEGEIAKQVDAWKERKKGLDGYLAHLRTGMNDLAVIVNTETKDRDVECSWLYALKQGYAFLVRDDTGELVHHRKLGDQEKQENLLEVLREPTGEQLATWTEALGLVIDSQGDLPLAEPGGDVAPAYYRVFVLAGAHGHEKITARFSEADHRPASLTGIHVHGEPSSSTGLPDQDDRSALIYEDEPETIRTYRQALENLLEEKQAEARKSRSEPGEEEPSAPTPTGRGKKGRP